MDVACCPAKMEVTPGNYLVCQRPLGHDDIHRSPGGFFPLTPDEIELLDVLWEAGEGWIL